MKIKALIFDLDDTLYKEVDYVFSGFMAVDKWLKENYDVTGFYNIATDLFNAGYRKNTFNKTLDLIKINYSEEKIMKMVNIYRTHEPYIQLLEDAKFLLNRVDNKVKLGIISDGYYSTQERKIRALNLTGRFHSIIISDSFGRQNWKPSPIPYIKASEELNISHNECVYVGDNLSKDFITAKKLGWKTVHINRKDGIYANILKDNEYHAHYQIEDLRELLNINELTHLFENKENIKVV